MEKIKFEFRQTNFFTRYGCDICSGCTEKVNTLCEVLEGEEKGLRVCERCLEAGKDMADERLKARIEHLGNLADYLRSLIGRLEIPSFEEWQKAEEKAEQDFMEWHQAELNVIQETRVFPEDDIPFP
jgi:hypothetical protein